MSFQLDGHGECCQGRWQRSREQLARDVEIQIRQDSAQRITRRRLRVLCAVGCA